ncbi:RCC1 domain-containing protein [Kutzneria sp. CA-103260]|uniref:RCC1 domain-containing protein n=1 Tax=Kutzneria sp. CA-103260 TaxID=2802641 RepID=UPI001BA94397|nr:hypothetical protein [Kutzneria sp. CA-103260]QUQ65978.1 Rhs family protein [Kutzneria sp. CA-103260]
MVRRALLLAAVLVVGMAVPAAATPTSVAPAGSGFTPLSPVGNVDVRADLDGYFAPASSACAVHCPVSWGANDHGELGTGTVGAGESRPGQVFGLSGITSVAGGSDNGAALDSDGGVWTWGSSTASSQSQDVTPVPTRLDGLPPAAAITYSGHNGYVLGRDGSVWGWGDNFFNQVTPDADQWFATPQQIAGPGTATAIAAGSGAAYLVMAGKVYGWGRLGDLGGPAPQANRQEVAGLADVTAISTTATGTVFARESDSTVWAWGGSDTFGERGAMNLQANTPPAQVNGLPAIVGLANGHTTETAYALAADGTVWSWGGNELNALGTGERTNVDPTPHQIPGPTGITSIAGGANFGLGLKSDGTVWSWGDNTDGQRGTNLIAAQLVAGLSGVTAIGAGSSTSYAVIG